MRDLNGIAAVLQQTMRLVALMPDCAFLFRSTFVPT